VVPFAFACIQEVGRYRVLPADPSFSEQKLSKSGVQASSAAPLYWVKKPQSVSEMVWDGFQFLNEAVLWGNHAWGTKPQHRSRQQRWLPRRLTQWLPQLVDWKYMMEAGAKTGGGPALSTSFGNKSEFSRSEWLTLIQRRCRQHGIDWLPVAAGLRDPATAVRLAYHFVRLSAARLGVSSPEVGLSLAVLRLAAGPLLRQRQCQVCFRVAFPGKQRCRFHSRSKHLGVEDANQASRTARLVARQHSEIRERGQRLMYCAGRERILAGAIFALPVLDVASWKTEVLTALSASDRVRSLLQADVLSISPRRLVSELRLAVDPDNMDALFWPDRIGIAERWLQASGAVAPGGPPRGARAATIARVARAKEMLKLGLSVDEVAGQLGLTVANTYQMLHRYAAGDRTR
jgi:hypothetical protein